MIHVVALAAALITAAPPCAKSSRVGPCPNAPAAHCIRQSDGSWQPDTSPCEGSRLATATVLRLFRAASEDLPRCEADLTAARKDCDDDQVLAAEQLGACQEDVDTLTAAARAAVAPAPRPWWEIPAWTAGGLVVGVAGTLVVLVATGAL